MARKKKEPDKLALDMIQCKKDGYGCHYGAWKAAQERPVVIEKKDGVPDGWKVCPHCGTPYKPNKWGSGRQIYCDVTCQKAAQRLRRSVQNAERQKRYRERKKAEQAAIAKAQEKERIKNEKFKAEQAELAEIMKVWKENRRKVQYESCSG